MNEILDELRLIRKDIADLTNLLRAAIDNPRIETSPPIVIGGDNRQKRAPGDRYLVEKGK
jgi:hypothetical protein